MVVMLGERAIRYNIEESVFELDVVLAAQAVTCFTTSTLPYFKAIFRSFLCQPLKLCLGPSLVVSCLAKRSVIRCFWLSQFDGDVDAGWLSDLCTADLALARAPINVRL